MATTAATATPVTPVGGAERYAFSPLIFMPNKQFTGSIPGTWQFSDFSYCAPFQLLFTFGGFFRHSFCLNLFRSCYSLVFLLIPSRKCSVTPRLPLLHTREKERALTNPTQNFLFSQGTRFTAPSSLKKAVCAFRLLPQPNTSWNCWLPSGLAAFLGFR